MGVIKELDEIVFADLSRLKPREEQPPFPLVGIVGQQDVKKALLLLASNPAIGNLLIIGEAGIGKATAARGLRDILPMIDAVRGCRFNCDPADRESMCEECRSRQDPESASRRTPLLEVPVGASWKRIFGGLDHNGEFRPGFVGRANRGYLILNRVNLMEKEVLDRLLAISETGANMHQEGDSTTIHPARINIIATMNPEEGEMDAGVLERFAISATGRAIKDIEERIEIVRRVEAYRKDPEEFARANRREMEAFAARVARAREMLRRIDLPDSVDRTITDLMGETGHGNDWVSDAFRQTALANAAFDDRVWVTADDIAETAPFVLAHRLEND